MAVRDVVERELVFGAQRSEVWAALTTVDGLQGWWCDRVEVDLRPGGQMVFHFGEEHGIHYATVVVVEPEDRFVFTWRPFQTSAGADEVPDLTTSVEFALEDHPQGTLLKLRETGFAALPGVLATQSLHENELGWDEEMAHLRSYLATGVPVVHG